MPSDESEEMSSAQILLLFFFLQSKKNWTQYRSQEKRGSEQVGRNGVAARVAGAEQYSKVSHSNMGHMGGPCLPGKEWFSQVELGVFITFVTLSNGCNAFKRIRFR
jgi:hypothetical protein